MMQDTMTQDTPAADIVGRCIAPLAAPPADELPEWQADLSVLTSKDLTHDMALYLAWETFGEYQLIDADVSLKLARDDCAVLHDRALLVARRGTVTMQKSEAAVDGDVVKQRKLVIAREKSVAQAALLIKTCAERRKVLSRELTRRHDIGNTPRWES